MARVTAAVGVLTLTAPAAAVAVTVAESTDAGSLPSTALKLEGDDTLDAITGSISNGTDQDAYAICLTGGKSFSATTTVGSTMGDTQLFLLDEQGRGIYANDDASAATLRSTLPAGHELTPDAEGVYLLAISGFNDDPVTESGARIFPNIAGAGAYGPLDPTAVHAGWSSTTSPSGAYRITLTGAELCSAEPEDEQAPSITLTAPADGAEYLLGSEVLVDFSCADEEGGSGLASCVGDQEDGTAIDTSTVGERSFTVVATDAAGNSAWSTHSFRVVYPYDGPFGPLADGVNRRKAGSSAPYRFSLGGDRGPSPVVAIGSVACDSEAAPEPAITGDVTYEDGVYQFEWKTDKAWSGTCRELLVELDDGTVHHTVFEFS